MPHSKFSKASELQREPIRAEVVQQRVLSRQFMRAIPTAAVHALSGDGAG
jgi:hypothetical protein